MSELSDFMSLFIICFQNNQRMSSSQSSQPLSTPVVSITTPSLPHQSLVYAGIGSAYNGTSSFYYSCCVSVVTLALLSSIFYRMPPKKSNKKTVYIAVCYNWLMELLS